MRDAREPDNLATLIEEAQQEALRARPHLATTVHRPWARWLGSACGATATAYALYLIGAPLLPHSTRQTARDLEAAVTAAGEAVERHKARTGQLPEALPNAALANVVTYQPKEDSYTLSATILGVRVTLASDGSKTTETGVSP